MGIRDARRFFLLGLIILSFTSVHAQGGLYQVSSDEKINKSSLIVEGKVVSRRSFWNSKHSMIFTSNQVEVYKIFKGTLQKNTINVLTVGGNVDNYVIQATHQLALEPNDIGVFFCRRNTVASQMANETAYEVYSSSQGFLKYDLVSKTADGPFVRYEDIEQTLYKELHSKTGQSIQVKNRSFSVAEANKTLTSGVSSNITLAPVITSFSPATVEGGALMDPANNVLTINGSGFGNVPSGSAAILFPHADKSAGNFYTMPFDSSHVISWTDAQIKVRVPVQAGTGIFRVRDNVGNLVNSPSTLTVLFTVLTAYFNGFGQKQFNMADDNGSGGYDIKYSTNTANSGVDLNASPAKGTFQRALTTWKETSGVNYVEAGNTTIQLVDPYDGTNTVMFDNGGTGLGPMPSGVLATCYSGAGICSGSVANQAFKTGFDIVIRNEAYSSGPGVVAFTMGPCSPYSSTTGNEVDLETVILHELGHSLNLGHIIDPTEGSGIGQTNPVKLMHFAISYNHRRISLDYSAKAGAAYTVTPHSFSYGGCVSASPEMIPLATTIDSKDECPASFPATTTPLFTTVPFDLVHTTSNKYVDPAYNQMTTDGTSTSITNTAFYAFKTNSAGGDVSLEITNYTTVPASLASCALGSTLVPVTGIQMSLYKVASCPAAQSFPTPVLYTTFKNNGILPAITGLSANSTYLMVLDGVENTKATFNMIFSGSALPLKFNEFNGIILDGSNQLTWKTDKAFEVTSLNLQRSKDGVNFDDIAVFTDAASQLDGTYNDSKFLPGANYYRLAVHNGNGAVEFSRVLLLTRTESFRINIFPNPAVSTLNVEILNSTTQTGEFTIFLHNSLGQSVYEKRITISPGSQVETINTSKFAGGVYHLAIYDQNSKKIRSSTIAVANK